MTTTAIVGSRTIVDYQALVDAIAHCPWRITAVVTGGAAGVDQFAMRWSREHNLPLHVDRVSDAEWEQYGKTAGPRRNKRLVAASEAVLAVWDGQSRGTMSSVTIARKKGRRIYVWVPGVGAGAEYAVAAP